MEQFEIERKQTRFIYLIKDTNMEFYLLIPNSSNVSITLNIMESTNNDIVKNIPDIMNKVIVIPILNTNVVNYLTSVLPTYNQADNYFSNLINTTYNILKHNKINVDSKVYLNNNTKFNNFNNYFVNRFNGRVSLITLDLEDKPPIPSTNIINNVVPSQQTQSPANTIPTDLDHIYNDEVTIKENLQQKEVMKKEPGFVSYVLLGVVVAILSLVFLYMIL